MLANIYKKDYDENRIAMYFKNEAITYGELDVMIEKYASFFYDLGLQKGDRIIINCINSPEFVYSYFGSIKIGAVALPINTMLTLEEVTYIVNNSGSEHMIIHETILEKLNITEKKLSEKLNIKVVVINSEFLEKIYKKEPFIKQIDIVKEDLVAFLYTSGTTGNQKAVMLSHHNQDVNSKQLCQALGLRKSDNILCVLPMFHVFALTAIILASFQIGASFTIVESFKPKEVMETLKKCNITMFMGVPAMYNVLLSMIKPEDNFPKLRRLICGAASMPKEVFKKTTDIFCPDLIEGYGLTEATAALTFNPVKGERKLGSVGVTPDGVECKIVDDDGNEMPVGKEGNLIARGENIMQGYYKNPSETDKAIKDGWLYTGDIGKTDEDGYFYIVDRKKDIIIVSGLNVYPREVEEIIYKHPKVKEAAVVGADDQLRGECVVAYIVLQDGETCNSRDFIRFLKGYLASYKVPRNIYFVESLPKNGSGKILKRLLREQN